MFASKTILGILTLAALSASCRTLEDGSENKSVFGPDDRQGLTTANPFGSVARLTTAKGTTCTAFMVSPRIGLTAGHCTAGIDIGGTMTMAFRGDNGALVSIQILERGSSSYTGNVNDDWAIFILTNGVRSNQWLGHTSQLRAGDPLHLSGYSVDFSEPTNTDQCSARSLQNGVIYHDCDMQAGASGGPIFIEANNTWYVVGIQSGHHSDGENIWYHQVWTISNSNLGAHLRTSLNDLVNDYKAAYPGN